MKALTTIARWAWNLALAAALIVAISAILLWGYAAVNVRVWERLSLDENVEQGDWLWIDEQPIFYREWGPADAPPVVLVHGHAVEGSAVWQANAQELADQGLRVIALDLRGLGRSARNLSPTYNLRSQANTLARALNELRVRDATLVGHGWGSGVVLQLASEQPQLAERLVLLAPIVNHRVSRLWRQIVELPYLGPAAIWIVSSGGPVWRMNQMRDVAERDALPDNYWDLVLPPTRVENTAEALRMMALSPADSDLPEALERLDMPILVLIGDRDWRVSEASAGQLAAQVRDAQLVVIAEAGHALQIEQAAQVNTRIADFALWGVR